MLLDSNLEFIKRINHIEKVFDLHFPNYVTFPVNQVSKATGFIEQEVQRFMHLHETGNYHLRDKEMITINQLLIDMEWLKKKRQDAFKKYKKLIRQAPIDQYYGYRFEIHIAAIMASNNAPYDMPDPPDFTIHLNDAESTHIECSSRHLNTSKEDSYISKTIINTIDKKIEKGYLNFNTALFIDITNLVSHNWRIIDYNKKDISKLIKDKLTKCKIGNISTFSWYLNNQTKEYQCGYNRFDNQNIDDRLKKLLDIGWPTGKKIIDINTINYPRTG